MNSAPDYLTKGLAILSERGKQYGSNDKERSFPQVAAAFNAITGHNITSADVCLMLAVLKMVRQNAQRDRVHEDSLVDCVNYAALWAQELNRRNNVTEQA